MPNPLLDGPPEARIAACAALLERVSPPTEQELDALCAALADPHKAVQRRAAETAAALTKRGARLGERLRVALDADELRHRWGAVYALSLIGPVPRAALPTLLALLGSDDGDLRWAAAELLKRLAESHREAVVGPLLTIAHAPGAQRKMALYCLRDLAVGSGFGAALAALADAEIETRLAALAVLAQVHPSAAAAVQHIVPLLDDADPRMQRAAAATLGSLDVSTHEVIDALRRVESRPDPSLRRAAARSLRLLQR